jgi:O-antigen/teichoic acid export membrane protein
MGLAGAGPSGLLLGIAAGRVAGCGGLASRHGLLRQQRVTMRQIAEAVRTYRRFPLMATGSAVLNSAGLHGPFFILGLAYGSVGIGLIGLTVRVLAMPVALIGQSVAVHYRGEASAVVRAGTPDLYKTLHHTARRLLLTGVAPAAILVLFGPWLFGLGFGAEWVEAGEIARIFALAYLAQLIVSPVSQTLTVLELQGKQLRWDASRSVLTLGGMLVCAAVKAPMIVAVSLLSVIHVSTYTVLYFQCARAARQFDSKRRQTS